ncbi:hypothetical protein C5Y96_09795, partial [Blastopirellula marina]
DRAIGDDHQHLTTAGADDAVPIAHGNLRSLAVMAGSVLFRLFVGMGHFSCGLSGNGVRTPKQTWAWHPGDLFPGPGFEGESQGFP